MNADKKLIMIVDDNLTNIELLATKLKDRYRIRIAKEGQKALKYIQNEVPDLIVLDIMMPQMDGFEVCRRLKASPQTKDIPIIFITAVEDTQQKTKGFEMGAVDYINKPFSSAEVLARIATHLKIRAMNETLNEKNRIIREALNEKSRQLDTLISNLPGMVYRCIFQNNNWAISFVSDGCQMLSGFKPSYFFNKESRHHDFFPILKDRDTIIKKVEDALKAMQPFELTYRIKTKDSQEKWVWEQGVAIYDQNGIVTGIEGVISDITEKQKAQIALNQENSYLRSKISKSDRFGDIIGTSPAMKTVYKLILKAAHQEDSVIIYGPSGTGKELVAKSIHDNSPRSHGPFVPVNCGAIPEQLFESEFFGYKKGAFSGANTTKKGYLDLSDGGTLFLDELGEISPQIQVKLLRVMDGSGFISLGGTQLIKPDIRFVSATNRDLKELVREKKFREDFFFRIHIIPITLPALKDRREDIPYLIRHFLNSYPKNEELPQVTDEMVTTMMEYHWPGNIRELQNVLYQYKTMGQLEFMDPHATKKLGLDHKNHQSHQDLNSVMENFEKQYLVRILSRHKNQKGKVAKILGIDRKTLFRKIKHYGIGQ